MKFLFCNTGWMEHYTGLKNTGDKISGGGEYVEQSGHGNEICNFIDVNGNIYGCFEAPGSQIDINRIGGNPDDDHISGVTIVWTAKHPKGGTFVVGWYQDATVFRNYQHHSPSKLHKRNGVDGYWIKAESKKSKLLSLDDRVLRIPRQVPGGMGQSNLWYADKPMGKRTIEQVKKLISGEKYTFAREKAPRKQDQDRKHKIEKVVIETCRRHFESRGYEITSVEKDNCGWDLIAKTNEIRLRIEVKGLSGKEPKIELTPNEYKAFSDKSTDYRLAIVTSALENPSLLICRYSNESDKWLAESQEEEKSVGILEKTGAIIDVS